MGVAEHIASDYEDRALALEIAAKAVDLYKRWTQDAESHVTYCRCESCVGVMPFLVTEDWHGTVKGYQYKKCRCVKCRKAIREYNQGKRSYR